MACKESTKVECLPIKYIEEILTWKVEKMHYTEPLHERLPSKNCAKTLVCHDMKGGYLEDRFVHGTNGIDCYIFNHWSMVDIFVYFSHNLVTIPPCSWITAAHRNGTLILGTFITEWDQGAKTCNEFLKNEKSVKELCQQLTRIAVSYGFDGWLINIENKIQAEHIPLLELFVKHLTLSMHNVKSESLVIWYDSVIETGELKWQNALNEHNKAFFNSCDGIFLNYNWSSKSLNSSLKEAGARSADVYVGVDVFGRGCPGGGGFCTSIAVRLARDYGLSIAIFAFGWIYECLDKDIFLENQYRFWDLLAELCPVRKIKSLPFSTTFCPGFGDKMWRKGKVISSESWFNLSLQNIQSSYHCSMHAPLGGSISVTVEDAYSGGGCLKLQAPGDNKDKLHSFGILSTHFSLNKSYLINYTFKPIFPTSLEFFIVLHMHFDEEYSLHLLSDNYVTDSSEGEISASDVGVLHKVIYPTSDLTKTSKKEEADGSSEGSWITRTYLLEYTEFKCHIIDEISAIIPCNFLDENETFSVLLGQIQILPMEYKACFIYENLNFHVEGDNIHFTCLLKWTQTSTIYCSDLYYVYNDMKKYICTTSQQFYNVELILKKKVHSTTSVQFLLHPQHLNGKTSNSLSLIIPLSGTT